MKTRLLNSRLAKWAMPVCTGLMMTASLNTHANNVVISNVALNMTSSTVGFDIAWDNSWRNTTAAGQTQNFDGVWVFIKYRLCSDRPASNVSNPGYKHAWLSTTLSDHTFASGSAGQVGTSLVPSINGTPRGMGVFVYRASDGTGSVSYVGNSLKWDMVSQGLTGANLDILVNAIEMVYIPSGGFYLGDGVNGSSSRFAGDNGFATSYLLNSENALNLFNSGSGTAGAGMWGSFDAATSVLPGPYPKGTAAFWTMKYEITQEQYKVYLNSLSRVDQIARVPGLASTTPGQSTALTNTTNSTIWSVSNSASLSSRNGIRITGVTTGNIPNAYQSIIFVNDLNTSNAENSTDDGQTIACNFLSPSDLVFYLDWSALAPMTELQFEKICRGNAVTSSPNEFVWGSTSAPVAYTSVSGTGTASELASPAGTTTTAAANFNNVLSPSTGPVRVGQAHRASTGRIEAASSYYGVADMAGNVNEFCVGIYSGTPRAYFNGAAGDGDVTTFGTNWPGYVNGQSGGWDQVGNSGIGDTRGGNFIDNNTFLKISDRSGTAPGFTGRTAKGGGRGVHN